MQPIDRIHLTSRLDYEIEPNGNALDVRVFSLVAVLIPLLAVVNFANLATARAVRRAREISVRKALGSSRTQLVRQFLGEGISQSVFALLLDESIPGARIGSTKTPNVYTNPSLSAFETA